MRSHALMTEAVHRHGALAGIELWHGGGSVMNRTTRVPPLSPSGTAWMATHVNFMGNQRPRIMESQDIRQLLRLAGGSGAQGAARRLRHSSTCTPAWATCPTSSCCSDWNTRSDAYGGSVENRVRIRARSCSRSRTRPLPASVRWRLRISLEELRGRPSAVAPSEAHEVVGLLAELPDLWDVKLDSSPTDCAPSRFAAEGSHEPVIEFVKKITSKPVVGVGRFTSPDAMVGQITARRARPDRRRAALHRRSVPAEQDRRGARAGHPRVHRLQHLHLQLARQRAGALHAEPDHRGGVAPRLAPGAHRAGRERCLDPHHRRRSCGPGVRARARSARLRGNRRGGGGGDRRTPALRDAPAGTGRLGTGTGLAPRPARAARQRQRLPRQPPLGGRNPRARQHPRGHRDRLALGAPAVLAAGDCPWDASRAPTSTRPTTSPKGRRSKARSWYTTSTTTTWAACSPSTSRRSGQQVSYVTPAGHASAWAIMSNEQPQIHRALFAAGIALHTLSRVAHFESGELTLVNQFTSAETPPALPVAGDRRRALRQRFPVRGAHGARGGAASAPASSRSRGSATPRRRVRSCTRSTAGTATRANWTPTRRASRTGATHRSAAPATSAATAAAGLA